MAFVHRLKAAQFSLSRSLLRSWITPTVLGVEQLQYKENDAICYVMPFRSTADLLAVDQACEDAGLPRPSAPLRNSDEKRAFFFAAHPEGRLVRRTSRRQSERMSRLFSTSAETDIKIVPVSIFWGHQPDKEKSIFKLILSENWTVTSSFKKLLAIVFHPRHMLIQFSSPVSLQQLMATEADRQRQIRKLLRVLRVHFKNQKQAIIGPDLSHRRTLINTVLDSKPVREAIEKEARREDVDISKATNKALGHAKEIASHQSYGVIRLFHVILTWLWNKLYDGIEVNHIEQVKLLARSHEIVYTPSHRSHIDYLLLSYVLYHNGLTPPHIAAGRNLNLPIVGGLLRRAGAFFMRRTFRGDALYKTVFDEYLHQMFTKGYSVEYFIEGGRSRTGRTLTPRTGMLSMTVSSFQRDSHRPICLMPVYFGYERLIEVPTYMGELSGASKKTESLFDIIGVLRAFKYSFGKVTVNFGEPVILGDFLDEHLPTWRSVEETAHRDFNNACSLLADRLVTNINSALAVTPISLVSTALLCTPRQTIEETHLLRQIEVLRRVAIDSHYSPSVSVTSLSTTDILEHAIKVAGITRADHPFGATISATPERAAMLTYYRNNTANIFALPSAVARFIRSEQATTLRDITTFILVLYPYLRAEFLMPWTLAEVQSSVDRTVNMLYDLGVIEITNDDIATPKSGSASYAALYDLAEIIEPTLERFYIVGALLEAARESSFRDLEADASAIAQKLSAIYGINSPTFFERSLFANFINSLKANQMIDSDDDGLTINEGFSHISEVMARTLDPDIRYNVLQALGSD
jgi:glycerol-3-phosphate O-acyltransferase